MKTNITIVTERGQVSVPAEIRKRLKVVPGTRLKWLPLAEGECKVVVVPETSGPGAKSMLGYARQFRETRPTREWMRELREGEEA
jgi:bifunctional DNA-binding transcriptional regulator/antitoxin component of YhaV-PrlF toxin-antitoxin module